MYVEIHVNVVYEICGNASTRGVRDVQLKHNFLALPINILLLTIITHTTSCANHRLRFTILPMVNEDNGVGSLTNGDL
jgi:hypothetical protein